jgi:5'-3' exonuclease
VAIERADSFILNLLENSKAEEYELWLSGGENFRYQIYPMYKANRSPVRPQWEQAVRQHLCSVWNANVTEGIEADDMLGIRQNEIDNGILCHLDKDLNQIHGHHFNWEIRRLGETVREKQTYSLSSEEADYWFFYQLLVGDTVDNIKGVSGIGPKKAAGILYGCDTNQERYEQVLGAFKHNEEELELNAQCVYIWRRHNDNWKNILNDPSISKSQRT